MTAYNVCLELELKGQTKAQYEIPCKIYLLFRNLLLLFSFMTLLLSLCLTSKDD